MNAFLKRSVYYVYKYLFAAVKFAVDSDCRSALKNIKNMTCHSAVKFCSTVHHKIADPNLY